MKKSGLCCISIQLQERGFKASTMTHSRFKQLGLKSAIAQIAERTLNNVNVVAEHVKLCVQNNWTYRITSGMMPLETLPDIGISIEQLPNYSNILAAFDNVKNLIQKNNLRCSTHPDQFVVPASATPSVVEKSIRELIAHGKMMDMFGLSQDYNSPINIHMNCFKGDINEIAARFIDVYNSLPKSVKSRLVLENEDKGNSWSVYKLIKLIHEPTGIPITYDSHHFRLNNPENISPSDACSMCMNTWQKFTPLFHYSNGRDSKTDRAHSDYVYDIHSELFENEVDVEFEFKMKDLAILKFQQENSK